MTDWQSFLDHLDWQGLMGLLISAASALLCITLHELAHGFTAYKLGDPTAKTAGRLTLNPVRHIDPLGLVMMLFAKVGWARPVPVDTRNFKKPRRDMALTALAGPASNFLLALIAAALSALIYRLPLRSLAAEPVGGTAGWLIWVVILCVLANIAILSVGLGVFNLIPLPPLDGAKVLFAFLPDNAYRFLLRYERYVMVLVVILTAAGVFSKPLSWLIYGGLRLLCALTGYPMEVLLIVRDISFLS